MYVAGEAIKVGFENRWTLAGRKLAHGIAVAAHRTGEHDFACSASIAHPVGIAASADEIAPPIGSSGSTGSERVLPVFRPRTSRT